MSRTITVKVNGHEEQVRIIESNGDPRCLDCNVDTDAINEAYMVHDDLWLAAVPSEAGALCVACFEKRLGRKLRRADFRPYHLSNIADGFPTSKRLKNRVAK